MRMGSVTIGTRVLLAAKAAASKALDRLADPRESLDYTYQRQAERLADLRRRAAEATAGAPREAPRPEQAELATACARLEVRVEASRVRRETGEVAPVAAEARTRLGEAWSGLTTQAGNAAKGETASQQQHHWLARLRSGITGLAECGGRLDRHVGTLRGLRAELAAQARQALEDGREDLAREAVARGTGIDRQLAELVAQRDSWHAEAARFTAAYERLRREAGS
jgi:phage shock protein A